MLDSLGILSGPGADSGNNKVKPVVIESHNEMD
jgi:hypothetical protein